MRRRGFLMGAGVAAVGAVAAWLYGKRQPSGVPPVVDAPPPPPAGYALRPNEPVFPPRYGASVKAMVARLYPDTPDSPGAVAAKAFDYIEGELRRSNMQGIRRLMTNGAVQLDRVSMGQLKKRFVELGPDEQDTVITAVQNGEGAPASFDGSAFVETAVILTIEGVFSDPVYGGNADEVSWRSIGWTMQSPRPVKA